MGTPTFQFKQFTIAHDRCAMKVGTDGVLVGAWSQLPARGRLLDVGTGTGLIALMVAQRSPASFVTGIDIIPEAVEQARENVAASPFADRIEIRLQSLQAIAATGQSFDAIICNPPFFAENLLPPDSSRSIARHTQESSLTFGELAACSARLLADGGSLSVILPTSAFDSFRLLCFAQGLFLQRSRLVQGTPRKAPKRVLATFVKGEATWTSEKPLILNDGGRRTDDYAALTHDFYLW